MPYRYIKYLNQSFYHIFNRGSNKQPTYLVERDYERFLETLYYYQFVGPKPRFSTHTRFRQKDYFTNPKIVDVICYCLMPNHYHLLLRQAKENGIIEFLSKCANSYTKYFNTKHNRSGPLFQGEYKAVHIESDEQLVHVSRYIHLNPYVSGISNTIDDYRYSSYPSFIATGQDPLCITDPILGYFKDINDYKSFVDDHAEYALSIEQFKHLTLDPEY